MAKKTQKRHSAADKKRQGLHHRRGHHYVKVYWPYIPLFLVIGLSLLLTNFNSSRRHILPYATDVSVSGLLKATNDERSRNGQKSLSPSSKLEAAAQAKAEDMARRNYWSHNTPDGKAPWMFIQTVGYSYQKAGENLAYGFNDSDATVAGWMNSSSHRANMLDNAYTEVGFGFANSSNYQSTGEETIVVAMYGRPLSATIATSATPPAQPSAAPASQAQADKAAPVTSLKPVVEPASTSLNYAQTLTGGRMPWITFAIGLFSGGVIVFLAIKHSLAIRKIAREGETFVLRHRYVDFVLISLIVIAELLSRTSGFIR